MWINTHKLNNSLIVLIHGIFGRRGTTWEHMCDFLQTQCDTDPLIRSYDAYLFGYPSSLFNQPNLVPWVMAQLDGFLGGSEINEKYKTIVLIAHSQGGLLAKHYILWKLKERRGRTLRVDLLITLGTPHRGSRVLNLNPLLWLRGVSAIQERLPLQQLADLASWSDQIRTLRSDWGEAYIGTGPPESTRPIRSYAVAGARDWWVGSASAVGFPPVDLADYRVAGHSELTHALSPSDPLGHLILRELRDHQNPLSIMRTLREIRADKAKLAAYIEENAEKVSEIVQNNQPWLPHELRGPRVVSILVDFLHDFEQRPLRGLDYRDALGVYAQRRS